MQKDMCIIHGHMDESNAYVCKIPNGGIRLRCKECSKARRAAQYMKNREQAIIDAGKWKKANRDRVNEQTRLDRKLNPEKYRKWKADERARRGREITEYEVSRRRGITVQAYYDLRDSQNNLCAICNKPEKRKIKGKDEIASLCIDHCHKTNKVRALLCHDCNTGIGKFYEDIELIQKAILYLTSHQ